jgi:hypothetical protein
MPFLPTSKSLCGAQVGWKWKHTCIVYIVKSKQGSKEKDVIILIKMCMCVEYIYMVAIIILLCSLKHVSLVWNLENTFAREHGLSFLSFFFFLSFFMAGIWVPIVLDFLHVCPFFNTFLLHSHMPLLQLKNFKKDINKNLEHLFLAYFFLCLLLV